MIRIHQGYVEESKGRSILFTDIDINDKKKKVYVSVENEYGKFLSPERADYALILMLIRAMRRGHDIICEAPVTEELLYNIREFLIPTLCRTDSRAYRVKIQADIAPPLDKLPVSKVMHGGVGTGLSFGVDSSYAILKHVDTEYPNQNLTHLCIFNNGAEVLLKSSIRKKVFAHAEALTKELNLPLIKVESNITTIMNLTGKRHVYTHTYKDAFIIYTMQKLWRVYYYGSTYSFANFSLEENLNVDPAHFEPFLLDCFSTSKLKIYSSGNEGDRDDKVAFIADNPLVQKYLHVCVRKTFNCGKCAKCLRTLLEIDALGKLDNFRESFNIDAYIERREEIYRNLHGQIKKNPNDLFLSRPYKILYERHKDFFDSLDAEEK